MADSADQPGCLHHVHATVSRGDPDPTLVCSCAAGLIHMHDCPALMGQECVHFRASDEPELVLDNREYDKLHTELMADFLLRSYVHRVRSLLTGSDSWELRREDLLRRYAEEWEDEGSDDVTPEAEARYVEERDRLIERRRKRDQERAEREQKTREERATERAKMGIKTVVEKARESVAARGNVSESIVDDMKLPEGERGRSGGEPKRRRRKRRGRGGSGGGGGGSGGGGEAKRKGPGAKPAGSAPSEGAPGTKAGPGGPAKKKRRRRRRRKPSGGNSPGGGASGGDSSGPPA